jgi:subtilisin family serine protease
MKNESVAELIGRRLGLGARTARGAMVLACCAGLCVAQGVARADEDPFVQDQVLVRLAEGASIEQVRASYGATIGGSVASRRVYLLQFPEGSDEVQLAQQLDADPRVLEANLNLIGLDEDPNGTTQSIFLSMPQVVYQGDDTPGRAGFGGVPQGVGGSGVTVAVLDSGVDAAHPLLAGRIAPGGFNFVQNNTDTSDLADNADTNSNGVIDEVRGHGTLVAGLVARNAPQARILPVRVMNSDGQAKSFSLISGIYHAIDQGATVINVSLTMRADAALLRVAVDDALARGVVVVASAGNASTEETRYPAAIPGVVGVAGIDDDSVRADFSNYGTWVDLAAPSVGVVSLTPGGGYGAVDGTSFGAPLVSAAAALLRGQCPGASGAMILEALRSGATNINAINPSYVGRLGAGALNAGATVSLFAPECPCDDVDFNQDGVFPDLADVTDFVIVMAGGPCPTDGCNDMDFNNDGISPDLGDVVRFLAVFAGEAC